MSIYLSCVVQGNYAAAHLQPDSQDLNCCCCFSAAAVHRLLQPERWVFIVVACDEEWCQILEDGLLEDVLLENGPY